LWWFVVGFVSVGASPLPVALGGKYYGQKEKAAAALALLACPILYCLTTQVPAALNWRREVQRPSCDHEGRIGRGTGMGLALRKRVYFRD